MSFRMAEYRIASLLHAPSGGERCLCLRAVKKSSDLKELLICVN